MQRIKALLNFARTTPENLLARGRRVLTSLYVHPAYSTPPVDKVDLEAALDQLAHWNVEVLDGSGKAFAARNQQVRVVVEMLRRLAHYAEAACEGNMETFLSSGFDPAPTKRTQTPPKSKAIRKIVAGKNPGQALITLVCDPEAYSYQVRWTSAGIEAADDAWDSKHAGNTRPATLIENLTPGTTYIFQVRSVLAFGSGAWSDPVTHICT